MLTVPLPALSPRGLCTSHCLGQKIPGVHCYFFQSLLKGYLIREVVPDYPQVLTLWTGASHLRLTLIPKGCLAIPGDNFVATRMCVHVLVAHSGSGPGMLQNLL